MTVPLKLKWRSVREDLPQVFAAKLFQGFDSYPAVDGSWAAWSAWTSCSATCDWGTRERRRSCTPPQQGGQPCEGEATQTEDCRAKNCPGAVDLSIYGTLTNIHSVDGQWLEWGEWSTCLGSCEHASRSRGRACTAPAFNGQPCRGDSLDTEECELHCPGERESPEFVL